MILLNPGPVNISDAVRRALQGPDLCHREPEFGALQDEIRRRLLDAYALDPAQWSAVLLTGSGTAAVEAMIATVVAQDARLLVLENGVYGERISAMARCHNLEVEVLHHEWDKPIAIGHLQDLLAQARPWFTHVAVVHHETTTGRLNRLEPIVAACREHGVRILVDGVSSFGAEAIAFGDGAIDACAATANKCLHGVPGIAFVVVRREALANAAHPARSVYLDLRRYAEEQDRGGTPFTQAIPALYALQAALEEFERDGGWRARHERYRALGARVREGLVALGIRPLLEPDETSVVLQSFLLPEGLSYTELHDQLKARGFVIYAGQGALVHRLFRISTMGAITGADIERLLQAFREILS